MAWIAGAAETMIAAMPAERPIVPPRLALLVGLAGVSTGALLVRLAAEAHPLVISLWRCSIATVLFAPFALPRAAREWRALTRRDACTAVAAGIFLGLHFQTWIASLSYTSIAASSVLVATTPLWVGLLTPWLSRDHLAGRMLLAIPICLTGTALIARADVELTPRALRGDALALAGAVAAALYFLAGRRLRPRLSLPVYLLSTYGIASAWLAAGVALGGHELLRFRADTLAALVALALVPQLVGHSTFNWALRWLSAGLVSIAGLGEPLIATLLGWAVLGERPGAATAAGGALLLFGIGLAIRAERPPGGAGPEPVPGG